jgi:geranylgeranyl pyrophosphate synthase
MSSTMPPALANLTDCIARELAAVERRFHAELETDLRPVNALVRHVSRFRGKMLRPCLVLLAGRACDPDCGGRGRRSTTSAGTRRPCCWGTT